MFTLADAGLKRLKPWCYGKKQHRTSAQANDHIDSLVITNAAKGYPERSVGLSKYWCGTCSSFHVGHTTPSVVNSQEPVMPIVVNPQDAAIVNRVVEKLAAFQGVKKVVAGSYSEAKHKFPPGSVKFVGPGTTGDGRIRIYTNRGMQNMHVYAEDLTAFESQLQARLIKAVKTEVAPPKVDTPSPVVPTPAKPVPVVKASAPIIIKSNAPTLPTPPPTPFQSQRVTRGRKSGPVYPAEPAALRPAEPVADTKVEGRLVTITPTIAANWLERNTKNRGLRDNDVHKYVADMKAGRWLPGGSVVKFDKNGDIINGQHVLWAVLESGLDVQIFVMFGLDPDVVLVEDDHARRTLSDVAKIRHPGWGVSNRHAGIANMLAATIDWAAGRSSGAQTGQQYQTRQQKLEFLETHWDATLFASTSFGKASPGVVVAPVMAVLARAYYTEDRDRLKRFAHVLASGIVHDTSENAAVLLRNQLLAGGTYASQDSRKATYYKTERALRAFLDREVLRVLKTAVLPEEMFPLPEEPKKRKKRTNGAV